VAQDYGEALRLYVAAAAQGNADAQAGIGDIYEGGRGVARDYAKALRWYRLAADGGSATGKLRSACCMSMGMASRSDDAEAARWYRRAADRGYDGPRTTSRTSISMAPACRGLREPCASTSRPPPRATHRPERDRDLYTNGLGVARDDARAFRWYRLAAAGGDAMPRIASP
jgi:TPR repeat protein